MRERSPAGGETVLVVDGEAGARSYLQPILDRAGYAVAVAADGRSALEAFFHDSPDLVVMDARLPGELDGFDVCRRLRSDPATKLTPVVIVTAPHERSERLLGIEAGADELIVKPFDEQDLIARVGSLIRLHQCTGDLDLATQIIMTLASALEARYGYGQGHCHRMASYATCFGRALGLDEADVRTLYRGAFLHDIGMLSVTESLVQNAGPLQPEERERIKSHTIAGDRLCGSLPSLRPVRPIVRHHHEHLDGSGYPDALRGDRVPLLAQIVGIVDTYEALTTARPYQYTALAEEAFGVLREHVRRGWRRKDLVETFVSAIERLHGVTG